ncbi:MAG: DUF1579 family protein [Acidobacteriaceae bacterium]|nr:DUF1579 family protein [Acidobacteriaceae bacterium]
MKNIKLAACIGIPLFISAISTAQQQASPAPAPELKKLDYFVGTWNTEGQTKPSPYGPGGSFTSTDRIAWQKGNYFVIGNAEFNTPMGAGTELSVMGYDRNAKAYTYESFNSQGEHEMATGTLDGDTWNWSSGSQSPFKWRFTEKVVSPTSFTMKFEVSPDGTNWVTVLEGKSNKQ